jgi:aromatic ring hydroxylase
MIITMRARLLESWMVLGSLVEAGSQLNQLESHIEVIAETEGTTEIVVIAEIVEIVEIEAMTEAEDLNAEVQAPATHVSTVKRVVIGKESVEFEKVHI